MENGNYGFTNADAATLSLLGNTYPNHANFAYDGSVIAAKIDANKDIFSMSADRVVDNQKAGFDQITQVQNQFARENVEFRAAERSAALDRFLYNQFSQIDRRFADQDLKAQECCCELKAGQATIIAKLEQQEAVRSAVLQAEQGAKLDALLARSSGPGQGN